MGISFIIPAYNAAQYITDCINSIVNLNLEDYEVWIVDDGSSDNTGDIVTENLRQWNMHKESIHLLRQTNAGVAAARNYALEYVKKEWVSFVDADDLLLPSFVDAIQMVKQHGEETDVFIFDLYHSPIRTSQLDKHFYNSSVIEEFGISQHETLMKNTLGFIPQNETKINYHLPCAPGKIYNYGRIIQKYDLRFPVGVKNGEDLLFNLQIWERCKKVIACHLPIYLYYTNMESLTHRYKPDMEEITYMFFDNLLPIVKRHPALWFQYHNSKTNNFFIECNQYLFHFKNTLSIKQKYICFITALNGYYHESFHYNGTQAPKKKIEHLLFLLIQKGYCRIAFSIFYLKFIIKRIINE